MRHGQFSSLKRRIFGAVIPAFAATVLITAVLSAGASADPSGETSIDDKALVTYGYLRTFREELKQEILNEIGNMGGTISSDYEEITLKCGDVISLAEGTEVIFRGGNAVTVCASDEDEAGFTDFSSSEQCGSGTFLQPGHIYYKTKAESVAYIVVTGDHAAFTIRGTYATH